jgi:hypothetical protein
MSSKIQLRRDSAANWTATNPVLSQGEPGLETDTNKVKYGDGSTAWNLLDYASGGGSGAGDYSTGFTDGVNDNTYHFTRVQGKKEFNFETEGYKKFEITLTAPMLAALSADSNLTFTATDTSQIADVWLTWTRENNIYIYKKADYDINNYSSYFNNSMTNPSGDSYLMNVSDNTAFMLGDIIVIKYWQEGTVYTGSSYDNYDTYIPDVSETAASNTVTISNAEFYNWLGTTNPGDAFADLLNADYFDKHALIIYSDNNSARGITDVTDNSDGTFTITFDGTPYKSVSSELKTFTFTAIDARSNDWNITVPASAYPTFASEASYPNNTSTNKYTGGIQRSGYYTINGGEPKDFNWYSNINGDQTQFYLNPFNQETYNIGDTIVINFYSQGTALEVDVYRPGNASNNWNNGYKWFDWKDDIGTEYNAGPGNGIMGGTGQLLMQVYREQIGSWSASSDALCTNFGFTTMGGFDQSPYDPYDQSDASNWGRDAMNCYPMKDFDESGIIFWSNQTYNDWSISFKARIIYRFDLVIGEGNQNWFNC